MPLFGSQPQIGAPFYIGSAEVFSKRLTSLDLHLEWKSPPADLFDHYRGYFDSVDSFLIRQFPHVVPAPTSIFCTTARSGRCWSNQILFAPVTTDPKTISAVASAFDAAFAGSQYLEQPDLEQPDAFDAGSKYGFVRLVLIEPDPERSRRRMPRRCRSRRSVTARFRGGTRIKPLPSAK